MDAQSRTPPPPKSDRGCLVLSQREKNSSSSSSKSAESTKWGKLRKQKGGFASVSIPPPFPLPLRVTHRHTDHSHSTAQGQPQLEPRAREGWQLAVARAPGRFPLLFRQKEEEEGCWPVPTPLFSLSPYTYYTESSQTTFLRRRAQKKWRGEASFGTKLNRNGIVLFLFYLIRSACQFGQTIWSRTWANRSFGILRIRSSTRNRIKTLHQAGSPILLPLYRLTSQMSLRNSP